LTVGLKPGLTIALAQFFVAGALDRGDRVVVEANNHENSKTFILPACTGKSWREVRFRN
jgi:hypothetical protein